MFNLTKLRTLYNCLTNPKYKQCVDNCKIKKQNFSNKNKELFNKSLEVYKSEIEYYKKSLSKDNFWKKCIELQVQFYVFTFERLPEEDIMDTMLFLIYKISLLYTVTYDLYGNSKSKRNLILRLWKYVDYLIYCVIMELRFNTKYLDLEISLGSQIHQMYMFEGRDF